VIAVGAAWGSFDADPNDAYINYQAPGTRISYPPTAGNPWGANYGDGLTLMGPSEVYTLLVTPGLLGSDFSNMNNFNGTAAATPNVAGVASLVWPVPATIAIRGMGLSTRRPLCAVRSPPPN
jgi:serine protease